MTRSVLITLGRLPKALDIARALSQAGCRVIVAEPFSWHLTRASRYVAKCYTTPSPVQDQRAYVASLLEIIEREGVSLVVPVSEEVLHVSLIDQNLPENVTFFSVDHDQLRALHDKHDFNQLAAKVGLAVPETCLLGTPEGQDLANRCDYILKPANTCSGKGFSKHAQGEALPSTDGLPRTLVQEQMKGALKSTFSICHQGRVIGTVVYQAAILSDSVAVAFELLDQETMIETWIERFVESTGHTGFVSFDMMENEEGVPHAIECNPRATSGIHFVEPEDLAGAVLDPANQTRLRVSKTRLKYQFWSSLTETQSAVFGEESALEKAKIMWKAKEVNFAWRDPLPLWLMPFTSWPIMKRAFLNGETFGEASTFDIAWMEETGNEPDCTQDTDIKSTRQSAREAS
ncbi:MAG: ATP-grasp domain-containing protein [Pseudomonadota bacterium]